MVKFNWNQTGMPVALVDRPDQKRQFAEFKSVLNDAGNHVMRAVDAESMARELLESNSREVVEMVRDLTIALAQVEKELESANRRNERLRAELARRGISVAEDDLTSQEPVEGGCLELKKLPPDQGAKSFADAAAEWEEWDRRFRSLLDC